MTHFLDAVARDLFRRFQGDMSRLTVVLPGKRAGLFLSSYLSRTAGRPVWAPRYVTIGELFARLSPLKSCDPIETVCLLHEEYARHVRDPKSVDEFYGWGEKLLGDFDDIDRNLVDAAQLFRNLTSIKEIEARPFLSQEQEQVLQDFFRDFSPEGNALLRERFLEMWNSLLPIYKALRERLLGEGKAYGGMMQREVAERLAQEGEVPLPDGSGDIAFVGLGLLSRAEKRLLSWYKGNGGALFYWDTDAFYMEEHPDWEAGTFMRENLTLFPNALGEEERHHFQEEKELELVSTGGGAAQALYAGAWLRGHRSAEARDTAIIMQDESLLMPLLHALPSEAGEVNITKGFPLHHSAVAIALEKAMRGWPSGAAYERESQCQALAALLDLTREEALREHDTAPAEGTATASEGAMREMEAEAAFQAATLLTRLMGLVERGTLKVNYDTLLRLVRRLLRGVSVPFHGEPVRGTQLLGMLEARGLDFENILLLSMEEGVFPPSLRTDSFIPREVRRAFGLTTEEKRESIFAYYFFRILARARRVTFVYNASCDEGRTGEASRFIWQLMLEGPHPIRRTALETPFAALSGRTPVTRKEKDGSEQELPRGPFFSPSCLNTWLDCRMRFHYRYVLNLPEPPLPPDVMDPTRMGTLFHAAAQHFYDSLRKDSPVITPGQLDFFLKEGKERLRPFVRQAYQEEGLEERVYFTDVLLHYLENLLRHDRSIAPFRILELEKTHSLELPVETPNGVRNVTVGGVIDRMDEVTDPLTGKKCVRVLDYKTGGDPETVGDLDALVKGSSRAHYTFQVFLYALCAMQDTDEDIRPGLFFLHRAAGEGYTPDIVLGKGDKKEPVRRFQNLADTYVETLQGVLREIYDPKEAYTPAQSTDRCPNCPYSELCGRRTGGRQ